MSQAGIINIIENSPTIPIMFDADTGTAIALFNAINFHGTGGITTSASGNTVTIDGSGVGADLTLTGQSGGPLSPTGNNWNIFGAAVAAGSTPIATSGVTSTLTVNVQRGQAIASTNAANVGLLAMNSAQFTVDANGFVSLASAGPFVESVTGTINRITSSGGQNPVIDISAAYVGQTSMTTLGTVTTGVWNGTTVGPTFGGTGQNAYAAGDILYASATNVLSRLPAASNTNVLTLVSGLPSWQALPASAVTSVTGNNGITTSPTTGAVVVSGVNATVTTVGVASFPATYFSVTTGAVTPNNFTINTSGTVSGGGAITLGGTLNLVGAASSISITGDSGGALTGNAFTFTGGTTGLTFAGAATTETLGGVLVVSNGGEGRASATAYMPIVGGTTSTGAHQSVAAGSTAGQVLAYQGATSVPTFVSATLGSTTGSFPAAGFNGENIISTSGSISVTTSATTLLSINITPGNWIISAAVTSTATNTTGFSLNLSLTNNSTSAIGQAQVQVPTSSAVAATPIIASYPFSTSGTPTIYLVGSMGAGSGSGHGYLTATRIG